MNKLDQQFREMMKGTKIDSPSSNFSEAIMERILAQEKASIPVHKAYQPVISHRVLSMIALSVTGLIIFLVLYAPANNSSFLSIWLSKAFIYLDQFRIELPDLNKVNIINLLPEVPSIVYLGLGTIAVIMAGDMLWQRLRILLDRRQGVTNE